MSISENISIPKIDHSNDSKNLDNSSMSKLRTVKNLIVLSLGFVLLFSAFMALTNLQSTMNKAASVGVVSQTAIYCALIASSLFLPNLLIKRFGCKLVLVVSTLTYSPYIAANFYPAMSTLLPTAILLGLGGANLWSSANTYINELSFMDAKGDIAEATLSTSRFFGIFLMCLQTTQIWGNIISFYVLRPSNSASEIYQNISAVLSQEGLMNNISCGVEFCGGKEQKMSLLPDNKRYTLIGIYFALSIIAAVVFLLFLDSLRQKPDENSNSKLFQKLAATFNQIKKTDQLLLIILTTFTGLEQGFVFADYTEAYVACALGIQSVGSVFVCFGIINAFTAFITGRLLKYIPRTAMMMAATVSNIGVCIALFCWKPNNQQVPIFYILVSFWGFSDAIWQTQLIALYGVLFRSDEEAAFASYRLWEGLGFMLAFSCSSHLCTSPKIFMQIGFLVVGVSGYLVLVVRSYMKNKD